MDLSKAIYSQRINDRQGFALFTREELWDQGYTRKGLWDMMPNDWLIIMSYNFLNDGEKDHFDGITTQGVFPNKEDADAFFKMKVNQVYQPKRITDREWLIIRYAISMLSEDREQNDLFTEGELDDLEVKFYDILGDEVLGNQN